jgi:hypothetical protein
MQWQETPETKTRELWKMTSFDESAAALALLVRATGRGFLTMRREDLRDAFEIGRFTEMQSEDVCEALGRMDIFIHPRPFGSGATLRLYDQKHPVAGIAEAVTRPDAIPETSLRTAAAVFAREKAGREHRSHDAPWMIVFDLFLQSVLGRELEEWEEMRDDRHPTELARELGVALHLGQGVTEHPATLKVAAAVCAFRPRRRRWTASELIGPADSEATVLPFVDGVTSANERLREEHERLLRQAARLLIHADEVPSSSVELGVLGLRYRREDGENRSES